MLATKIKNIKINEENVIQGFVKNIRDKKNIAFLVVEDITGEIQVTILKDKHPEFDEIISKLTIDSVITIVGKVVSNPNVKLGGVEMLPESIILESIAAELPVDENSLIDQRLAFRWIDLRSKKNHLIWKVQTLLTQALREFCIERDLIEIHSPKIINAASESGSEVFELQYFDRKAYLAQSPQFYKQMALMANFGGVFETGPVFRAEKSHTHKHATEFTGFDIEIAGVSDVEDVMKFEEELLTYALTKVSNKYGKEIEELFGIKLPAPTLPFPRMHLDDVVKELGKRYGYVLPSEEAGDLPTEGEKLCKQLAKDKFGHEFIFITGYDTKKRAFYHIRKNGIAQGFDLVWRGTEITTGAMREHRYDILKQQAAEKGLGKDIQFYLEFFKYGAPTHGGFGVGLDRLTMLIFGTNIKETQFIFRGPNNVEP